MPNRIIKESICDSEKLASLKDFEFRLWVGLITQADDMGRGDARPPIIKGRVFPLREQVTHKNIADGLNALESIGLIALYTVGGRPFFWFPSWSEHQRVRDCKPKFPGPEDADNPLQSNEICGNPPRPAASCGLNTNTNTIQSKSESKGKKATKSAFVPPTLDEIKAYCAERRSSVNAQKFFDYFDASGWVDSRGKPVLNWKQKLITWENHSDSGKRQAETESDPELDAIF